MLRRVLPADDSSEFYEEASDEATELGTEAEGYPAEALPAEAAGPDADADAGVPPYTPPSTPHVISPFPAVGPPKVRL